MEPTRTTPGRSPAASDLTAQPGATRYPGRMTYPGESTVDARVRAVIADFTRRQNRLFVTFALIEGIVLAVLVAIVYGFALVDPEIGIWYIVAVAMIGGIILSTSLMRLMRARMRAIAQAKGENPLF